MEKGRLPARAYCGLSIYKICKKGGGRLFIKACSERRRGNGF